MASATTITSCCIPSITGVVPSTNSIISNSTDMMVEEHIMGYSFNCLNFVDKGSDSRD